MNLRPLIVPVLGAALVGAVACNDLPTSAPLWNTTWILPIKADTIRVSQFLPSSVDTAGNLFVTAVKRDSIRQSLGQMCAACGAAQGTTVAVPGFTFSLSHTDSFPSQVISITPGGGFALSYRIVDSLDFDLLRPGAGNGTIVTTVKDSAGNVVATDSLNGATDSLPAGTALTRNIPLGSTPIGGLVQVVATVTVPGTSPVLVDTAQYIKVVTVTDTASLAGVTVQLTNQSITADSVSVDWSNIGSDIQSKMQGAELQLTLHNPFTASGTDSVFFQKAGVDVIPPKGLNFPLGVTTQQVGITQGEIQSLTAAGQSAVRVTGSVSGTGPGQSVTITPSQVAIVQAHVLITIRVGGN